MSDRSGSDILVVGGGVVGLAAARALALQGASVTVLERDRPAAAATWAAGGMLAPLGEAPGPGPFLAFALAALEAWPAWAAAVVAESGRDIGYVRCGKLLVAEAGSDAGLRARHAWQSAAGHPVRWLDRAGVEATEPALAPRWTSGVHLEDHARVDPRRLGPALAEAARNAGAVVREGVEVAGVERTRTRITGVRLADGGTVASDVVVVAAGAWSGALRGLPRPLPVRPVRGQMLSLELEEALVDGLVAGPGAYLIPREADDGPLLVIGASMEEAGFELATDPDTVAGLRRAAEALVPALRGRRERARWAGFRPAAPDDLPVVGSDPEVAGLVYATGHHRNGILLAPVTAAVVADLAAGRTPDPRWAAFAPARFGDPGAV